VYRADGIGQLKAKSQGFLLCTNFFPSKILMRGSDLDAKKSFYNMLVG
jgi:hypothetical protein